MDGALIRIVVLKLHTTTERVSLSLLKSGRQFEVCALWFPSRDISRRSRGPSSQWRAGLMQVTDAGAENSRLRRRTGLEIGDQNAQKPRWAAEEIWSPSRRGGSWLQAAQVGVETGNSAWILDLALTRRVALDMHFTRSASLCGVRVRMASISKWRLDGTMGWRTDNSHVTGH